jgi:hypothetical protein
MRAQRLPEGLIIGDTVENVSRNLKKRPYLKQSE